MFNIFQFKGGKRPKRGQPWSGAATINIGDNSNDGIKLKTCLVLSDRNVVQVVGKFVNGQMQVRNHFVLRCGTLQTSIGNLL